MAINIPPKNSPDSCFERMWMECQNRIGSGTSRDVYEIPESNKVLKVSNRPSNFTNWCEIVIYSQKKDTGELAEIFSWSISGRFIVMERLTPLEKAEELKGFRFPDYLTDRKPRNYGRDSNENIKALDYASLAIHESTSSIFS